jgi:NAD(P)-dependent dehydrogenase (short-subunit alcohol dehydrogenase family)
MSSPKYVNLLKDKRCVVLGGTSGIGLAVAEALIEEGARVHIGSSSQDKVDATIKQLSDSSKQYNADRKRISGTAVNLKGEKMEDSIRQFFKAIPKEWNGKVDHIIHTAGDSLQPNPIDQVSYQSIISAGQVRFVSCVLTAKVGMEFWDKGGSYIVTSGSVSIKPIENWAVSRTLLSSFLLRQDGN